MRYAHLSNGRILARIHAIENEGLPVPVDLQAEAVKRGLILR
jgi:hypothetical protein